MYSIEFKNVVKQFGKTEVIKGLDLAVRKGERLILLGSSGCGKSTILRMISGLETITSGELYLNEELANDKDPGDRNIGMVFQNYALYPHMTVEKIFPTVFGSTGSPKEKSKNGLPMRCAS